MSNEKRQLPAWLEPMLILLISGTAWFEYNRGEQCFALGLAAAAILFAATGLYRVLKR